MNGKTAIIVAILALAVVGFALKDMERAEPPTGDVVLDTVAETAVEECTTCDVVEELVFDEMETSSPEIEGETKEFTKEDLNVDKITVDETDLVKLVLDATDPDGDQLFYSFSDPLGEDGTWQTVNGDAGLYEITIAVSDGEFEVTKNVYLEVQEVNFAPKVLSTSHDKKTITAEENSVVTMTVDAFDPDEGDEVSFAWYLNDELVGDTSDIRLELGFDAAGEHELAVVLSDGEDETTLTWMLEVANSNRAPFLQPFEEVIAQEQDTIVISPVYGDPDKEDLEGLTVTFGEPFDAQGEWQTSYDSAGGYLVPVVVSDGDLSAEQVVRIVVENTNRLPVISDLGELTVKEDATLTLSPAVSDPDGDEVVLTIGTPFDASGSWTPSFEDSGMYTVVLQASDGIDTVEKEVSVEVLDVNRAPVIEQMDSMYVTETDLVVVEVNVQDPDNDLFELSFSSPLDEDGLWETDFESAGEYPILVTATDGELVSTMEFTLNVVNKNRPPVIFGVTN